MYPFELAASLAGHMLPVVSYNKSGPIAGFAVDKVPQAVGYVSLGYPFGVVASILLGRHHKAILQSPKPKLFVMVSAA